MGIPNGFILGFKDVGALLYAAASAACAAAAILARLAGSASAPAWILASASGELDWRRLPPGGARRERVVDWSGMAIELADSAREIAASKGVETRISRYIY